jgi:hypothetical protein
MIPRRTVQEIPLGSLQPAKQSMTVPFEDAVATKPNGSPMAVLCPKGIAAHFPQGRWS